MKKYFISLLMVPILFLVTLLSTAYAQQAKVSLSLIHPQAMNAVLGEDLKRIYLNAFSTIYKDHWTDQFEQEHRENFDYYLGNKTLTPTMALIVALQDQTLVGWVLFNIKDQKEAVLELISIDPQFWRQEIGRKLVFAIRKYRPAVKKISVVTRKINAASPSFYTSLGFKKTSFTLDHYNPEDMQGYEWRAADITLEKDYTMQNAHYVVVILEAKEEAKEVLKIALSKVKEQSQREPACISYTVIEDINNPCQFVLSEVWTSQEEHAKQFQKDYIIAFGNQVGAWLSKPYHYVMGKKA